jgi:voltage-gated potassium channel Kch
MSPQPTLKERWNYWFDNYMSRGTLALIGGLGVISLLIIFISAAFVSLGGRFLAPDGSDSPGFIEAAWMGLMRTLDAGTMGGDAGWGFRLVMFGVTLGGVFIISTLIGVLTAGVEGKIEELRKGRSRVLESNHTVILGWSPQVFTIVPEIVTANENQKSGVIAILADKDKVEMEEEIRERVGPTGKTKVICRSGAPIDPTELEIISPHTARAIIIILPPEAGDPDSYVIKTALALTNNPNRRAEPYHIVTQISDQRNLNVLQMIGERDDLHAVLTGDVIARVTAQTSRQSGLSMVYTELLDFGGDEIYFKAEPSLSGKTFGDALNAYEDSMVIGLSQVDGSVALNPPMDTRIAPGDQVIAIAADDDTLKLSGLTNPPVRAELIHNASQRAAAQPEKGLLIGWNASAPVIIRELDNYVAKGSTVTVFADQGFAAEVKACSQLKNQKLSFQAGDTTNRSLLDELKIAEYDHVIVLADTTLDLQVADARTLITLLHLRDIAEKDETPFSIVSEMLDLRNRELAEVTKVDDFIVSDHLISLMMSQLSENGDLDPVFTDLFDPEGSELYLKPVADYVETGQPVNFYTVVEAARRRGEVAIGYRIIGEQHNAGKSYGVRTNPPKSEEVIFTLEDKIIVLAEE